MRHRSTPRRVRPLLLGLGLALGLPLTGCDQPVEDQPLRITVYGEEYLEDRIPTSALIDGWELEFSRFLIAIDGVQADGVPLPGAFVLDLTRSSDGEGHELGALALPAEGQPHLAFSVQPVTEATPVSTTEQDAALMIDQGLSIQAEGEARKGDATLRFSWGFASRTRYEACQSEADLAADADPTSQLTIHADHFFYDDLDSEEPNVAFDLIASADADGDGEVTPDELRAVDITGQARYQVGSRPITDLWGFIVAQTGTLGHIDGEGHCELAEP